MTKPNDGGPAFARPGFTAEQTESQEGMSLRDWFAGQAIAGLLASRAPEIVGLPKWIITQDAYETADAMLAAREKGMTNE